VAIGLKLRENGRVPRIARIFFVLATVAGVARASSDVQVQGTQLVDGTGRALILRGVNVTGDAKVPPFRPVTPAIFDPLPGLGIDVVRLLYIWEAYEPSPGTYDASYLSYYTDAVHAAAAKGIYVIVDFHQDAYSRFDIGGCGEGFPKWALPPTVTPATPDNGAKCIHWGTQMGQDPDLGGIWNSFFSDVGGVRTRYLAMVTSVATALANEPNVLGYDLLNEPGGDEPTQLAPLYEDEAKAIRAVDPKAILFVSPRALTSAGIQTQLPKPSFGNFVYSPHYYDAGVIVTGQWNGSDEKTAYARMATQATTWGVPLFVGEFGSSPTIDGVEGYMDASYAQLDALLASGAQWAYTPGWTDAKKDGWNLEDFSIVDGSGMLRSNFRARPHVRRVTGTPTSIASDTSSLTFSWTNVPAQNATELFVPPSAFGATSLAFDTSSDVSCASSGDIVSCSSTSAGPKTVRVHAPPPPQSNCGLTGMEALLLLGVVWAIRKRR
jgi:endoglycosylceramidase